MPVEYAGMVSVITTLASGWSPTALIVCRFLTPCRADSSGVSGMELCCLCPRGWVQFLLLTVVCVCEYCVSIGKKTPQILN